MKVFSERTVADFSVKFTFNNVKFRSYIEYFIILGKLCII